MRTSRRKSTATRSPSAAPLADSPALQAARKASPFAAVHELPPATFGTPALQLLIYATSNDRYPGAPGTLLHRAKLEAARALAAKQRETQREAERRDEMKRLGILGVGKKRSTANARTATPPSNERSRRSNGAAANVTSANTYNGGTSTRPGRANGARHAVNAIEHDALPAAPAASSSASSRHLEQPQPAPTVNGAASPLLSASGRLRRPANGSRGASPMPLTSSSNAGAGAAAAAATTGTGMATRRRSPIVPALELDEEQKNGNPLIGSTLSASSVMV